ncbi:MAG: TonB-dependent receptor plug domain-containing protein, partial [Bacteroidales bacterium]|nr:TonB-dependent receptor plug domain-containing protein [Candidatus Egerieousia equi]
MSGYKEATVQILNKAVIDVKLNVETEVLDDVMVVAYGTVKKESFTGSASTVKKEDIVKRSVSNVSKALDGLAPGIVSTSGGGQPGSTATIQIRGFGSINASTAPLYVVDGIPYDGALNSINPADIESVSVLKDASAGALYGARGANGVIMITTKRGSKDRTQVTYRGLVGVSSRSIARYDLVGQNEFVELTWEALKNGYQYNSGYSEAKAKAQASADLGKNLGGQFYNPWKNKTWETLIDPNTGKIVSDAVSAWDENWMDEITNNAAFRTEHTFAVSGGNDKTQFLMSLGYLYENGVLKHTHFDRYSGKV